MSLMLYRVPVMFSISCHPESNTHWMPWWSKPNDSASFMAQSLQPLTPVRSIVEPDHLEPCGAKVCSPLVLSRVYPLSVSQSTMSQVSLLFGWFLSDQRLWWIFQSPVIIVGLSRGRFRFHNLYALPSFFFHGSL